MALEWCIGILMFGNHVLLTCVAPRAIIVPNTPDNLLPGKSYGWKSQSGYSPWGSKESDMTEWLLFLSFFYIVISYKHWLIWVKLILIIPPQILLNCFLHYGLFLRNKNQFSMQYLNSYNDKIKILFIISNMLSVGRNVWFFYLYGVLRR